MPEGTQELEIARKAALQQHIDPDILIELLALAPKFENFHVYGAKAQFTHAVAEILDRHAERQPDGPTA